jgi:hypothetical protein
VPPCQWQRAGADGPGRRYRSLLGDALFDRVAGEQEAALGAMLGTIRPSPVPAGRSLDAVGFVPVPWRLQPRRWQD